MHTEVISFPAKDSFVPSRRSFIEICDGDTTQAFVLSYLLGWTNSSIQSAKQDKLEDLAAANAGQEPAVRRGLWIYRTLQQMEQDMGGMFSDKTIGKALNQLVERGFIRTRKNPTHRWDRTSQYLLEVNVVQAKLDALSFTIDDDEEGGMELPRFGGQ